MAKSLHRTLREHGLSDEEAWASQVFGALPADEFEQLVARDDLTLQQTVAEAEQVLQRLGLAVIVNPSANRF
jgi:hypothetical protein